MQKVVVDQFGGPEVLRVVDAPTPDPGHGQVRVRVTSVGMNHADLMGRAGQYKLATGDPPFTPGIEGGGVIDAIGAGVTDRRIGQRVILGLDAPRRASAGNGSFEGTYVTHFVCDSLKTVPAPDAIPDEQLGAVWLAYLTAWGALVWHARVKPGQFVAIPAASSSVGLAAAQVASRAGTVTIGLTSSADKVERLRALATARFDHLVVTHDAGTMRPWHRELRTITADRGVDVFLDPVASGAYLETEIKCLAQHGTIYVYGLLGQPGPVDVQPLIRKHATIRGWVVGELVEAGVDVLQRGYREVLDGFTSGVFRQHIDRTFRLNDVVAAHQYMERGKHIGKLVIVP